MRSIKAAADQVSIWVRANEEDPEVFVYRAVSTTNTPPNCYRADPSQDARSNWIILSTTPLALPGCAARSGPTAAGSLYALRRAQ